MRKNKVWVHKFCGGQHLTSVMCEQPQSHRVWCVLVWKRKFVYVCVCVCVPLEHLNKFAFQSLILNSIRLFSVRSIQNQFLRYHTFFSEPHFFLYIFSKDPYIFSFRRNLPLFTLILSFDLKYLT